MKGHQLHLELLLKKDTILKSISIELIENVKILTGGEMEGMQRFPAISCNNLQQAVLELLPDLASDLPGRNMRAHQQSSARNTLGHIWTGWQCSDFFFQIAQYSIFCGRKASDNLSHFGVIETEHRGRFGNSTEEY